MLRENLFALLDREFDTGHCTETLRAIWDNDRWFDFTAFARTARFCADEMARSGLEQVEVMPLRANGDTAYGDWPMPRAWEAESATLSVAATGEILADYLTTPTSLVMYSAPTPSDGLNCEIVQIGEGDDADEENLSGKLLFCSRPAEELVPLAIRTGAAGIVTDFFPLYPGVRDNREQMRGHSRWENAFRLPRNDTGLFAFNLSPESGDRLRELLRKGPVRLHAEVDTHFHDGEAFVVSGAIPGETAEEVLAYGHLYEPGALDNASGCATLLELARCMTRCIREGLLPKPLRTLRFVLGWECVGSTAWLLAHPEQRENVVCGLVADMVGTEEIDNTHMCLWHNPLSNYSFPDALISQLLGEHRAWLGEEYPAEEKPFSLGTDNVIGDPWWGIPTVAMITEPALSYHSSLDRPERIDPAILKRCAVLLGSYLWQAANLSGEELARLDVSARCSLLERGVNPLVTEALAGTNPPICGEKSPIPTRIIPGCLNFAGRDDLAEAPWQPAWSDRLHLPLFWADGARSLEQIILLSSAEAGDDSSQLEERRDWLTRYFQFLAEQGYLTYNQ